MRRTLCFLAILAVALSIACSRQPQYHIGEWDAKVYFKGNMLGNKKVTIIFGEDNKNCVAMWEYLKSPNPGTIFEVPPGLYDIWDGEYKIDYTKDPCQLDIKWIKNWKEIRIPTFHGIFRFVGEGKDVMQYVYCRIDEGPRPTNFDNTTYGMYILTKKVKK